MGCNTSAPIIIKQVPTSPVLLQELRPIKSSVFISQAKGQITDFFEIIKALDTPGTCPLFHAKEVHTGTYRTIKEISKHLITESGQVYQEYKILSDIDHPNIEKIYKTIETPRSFYIVYESIQGGTIKSRVKKIGDESTVSKYFVDILSALNYLHNLEVIHCNINLDNIMMSDGSPEAIVKLTDFSFSQKKAEIQEIDLKLIAHEFTSPEMLQGKFDTQTDMWSIGILLYWLLVGRLPYEPTDKPGLIESVYYGKIEKECQAYNVLTNNAKDLISKLLVVDPLERLTAQQVLQHDWVKHGKAEGKLSFAIIHKMRSFKVKFN